jgi:hypothetical protein
MGRAAALLGFAAVLFAQPAQKPVLGTVTQFKTDPLSIGVKPDNSEPVFLKFGPDTQVVRIPPGEHRLDKAQPAELTGIMIGDRVLVSFVEGMPEARRIVLIPASDIERRNNAERLDWQKRGISGLVTSKQGNEVALQIRTPQGAHTITVVMTEKTNIRRYAPDSVKFTDAEPVSAADIVVGDQFQARGEKSEDGTLLTAEDIVFGTFITRVGTIKAVNRDANEIEIEELAMKTSLTIRIAADSRLKLMPDMRAAFRAMMSGGGAAHDNSSHAAQATAPAPESRTDILRMIERLPPATMDNLKVGGGVIVTSTRGAASGKVTAILLLANADSLIQSAQKQAAGQPGKSTLDVISGMHGGMLGGPGGLNLPAMMP